MSAHQRQRQSTAKREAALGRAELRETSEPREAPVSPTSFPVKKIDMDVRAMIDAALAKRSSVNG
jgi:hypothetical protein